MGSLLTLDTFLNQFPKVNSSSSITGATISIYEIGCMMGALTAMNVGDKFGRRKMIFGGAIVMTVGAILQASSFSLGQLIVGRIVTGV
jgi:MFS family permease